MSLVYNKNICDDESCFQSTVPPDYLNFLSFHTEQITDDAIFDGFDG